jgi:hypothetical protein
MGSDELAKGWVLNNENISEIDQIRVDKAALAFLKKYSSKEIAAEADFKIYATVPMMTLTTLTES